MAKRKTYQKDENGNSILGTQHGIQITRPWNKEMYDHNDTVSYQMKDNIEKALNTLHLESEEDALRSISKHVCAYGFGMGYDAEQILERTLMELERAENFWLHEEYPDLVIKGFVPEIEQGFVGYDKL